MKCYAIFIFIFSLKIVDNGIKSSKAGTLLKKDGTLVNNKGQYGQRQNSIHDKLFIHVKFTCGICQKSLKFEFIYSNKKKIIARITIVTVGVVPNDADIAVYLLGALSFLWVQQALRFACFIGWNIHCSVQLNGVAVKLAISYKLVLIDCWKFSIQASKVQHWNDLRVKSKLK